MDDLGACSAMLALKLMYGLVWLFDCQGSFREKNILSINRDIFKANGGYLLLKILQYF